MGSQVSCNGAHKATSKEEHVPIHAFNIALFGFFVLLLLLRLKYVSDQNKQLRSTVEAARTKKESIRRSLVEERLQKQVSGLSTPRTYQSHAAQRRESGMLGSDRR